MDSYDLSLSQAWTVINALHTAADTYEGFAAIAEKDACDRIEQQFRKQAQEALNLADLISKA